MNSFEWEVFKRTGKIEHFLLLKDVENDRLGVEMDSSRESLLVEALKEE